MESVTLPPQKLKLLRAVEGSFVRSGWKVDRRDENSHDFRVDCGRLCFFVKCLDETRINYESVATILTALERHSRELRSSGNRQLIVVFDRNFLSIDLEGLVSRGIFALTADDLAIVADLAAVSDRNPGLVGERQAYLLKRSIDYAVFVSMLHYKGGDIAAAMKWGRYAVDYSAGYSFAYLSLFGILKGIGEFDAAAELGEKIEQYRPDDRHFLLGMEDLARKRGSLVEALEWRRRLIELPTTPRTFEDILAQRDMQKTSAPAPSSATPVEVARPAERGLARLFKALRRPSD